MTEMSFAIRDAPIGFLLDWIKDGKIAIPEIQRPFVWDAKNVRDFLDSLFKGWPVGYLITWQNPDVKLKDGTSASGKYIIIDGQQRAIALMAALLGRDVVDKDYKKKRICIAFNPIEKKFEVRNASMDTKWIEDISVVFRPFADFWALASNYCEHNPGTAMKDVFESIQRLGNITFNPVGLIELNSKLDIDTVTEIFIRVNSKQVPLSQADFAMSKIAVNETYGGNMLRKAIDYFCHLKVTPMFYSDLKRDSEFVESEFFQNMSWLHENGKNLDIYNPLYKDMLRVAFTTEFRRGPLKDLVALLSGRNFETRQNEEVIIEDSFIRLKSGINRFMSEYDFKYVFSSS
ncbi:MAG: DUF262 domain-containing protein [Methanothrix sp.]